MHARSFISDHYSPEHVEAFDHCYHPAMRCDYFRLCYLYKHGGFYVDADEVYQGTECESFFNDNRLKIQPLCYDTAAEEMVKPKIFLKDTTCPPSRIFYVNNNPIIAPPGHELLLIAIKRSTRILLQHSKKPEIQETTGPGNLSASLVVHVLRSTAIHKEWDFQMLRNWEDTSVCRWPLSFRNDKRNWRLINNQ